MSLILYVFIALSMYQHSSFVIQKAEHIGYGKFKLEGNENGQTVTRIVKEMPGINGAETTCINEPDLHVDRDAIVYLTADMTFIKIWKGRDRKPYRLKEDENFDFQVNSNLDLEYCHLVEESALNFKVFIRYNPYWLKNDEMIWELAEYTWTSQNFWTKIFNDDLIRINTPSDFMDPANDRNETAIYSNSKMMDIIEERYSVHSENVNGVKKLKLMQRTSGDQCLFSGFLDSVRKVEYVIELQKSNLIINRDDEIYLIKSLDTVLYGVDNVNLIPVYKNDELDQIITKYVDIGNSIDKGTVAFKNGKMQNSMPFFTFSVLSGFELQIAEVALLKNSQALLGKEMFMIKHKQGKVTEGWPSIQKLDYLDAITSPTTKDGRNFVLFTNFSQTHEIGAFAAFEEANPTLLNWESDTISYVSEISNDLGDLQREEHVVPIFIDNADNNMFVDYFDVAKNTIDDGITFSSKSSDLHYFDFKNNLEKMLTISFFVLLEHTHACDFRQSSSDLYLVSKISKSQDEMANYKNVVPVEPNSDAYEMIMTHYNIYTDDKSGEIVFTERSQNTVLFSSDLKQSISFVLFVEITEENREVEWIYKGYPQSANELNSNNFACIASDSKEYDAVVDLYRFMPNFESVKASEAAIRNCTMIFPENPNDEISTSCYKKNEELSNFANLTEGPKVANLTEGSKVANLTEGPEVANLTDGPKVANLTEGPGVANLTEGPKVANLTEDSKVANLTEGPKVANLTNGSKVANLTEGPRVVNLIEDSDVADWAEIPIVKKLSDFTDVSNLTEGPNVSNPTKNSAALSSAKYTHLKHLHLGNSELYSSKTHALMILIILGSLLIILTIITIYACSTKSTS